MSTTDSMDMAFMDVPFPFVVVMSTSMIVDMAFFNDDDRVCGANFRAAHRDMAATS